jgi:hypothetical protein
VQASPRHSILSTVARNGPHFKPGEREEAARRAAFAVRPIAFMLIRDALNVIPPSAGRIVMGAGVE